MVSRYKPRSTFRPVTVNIEEVIGERASTTPDNTFAHRHARRAACYVALRASLRGYARQGKLNTTWNEYLGLERFEFSDGSMMVFDPSGPPRIVDTNDSGSLRAYFNAMGSFAAQEAWHIHSKQLASQGWNSN